MGTNRARAHPRSGASLEPRLVTLAETDLVAASHGLRVEPDGTLGDPDILLVPGGGWTTEGRVRSVVEARTVPEAVGERFAAGSTVASVCTGAMILAEADVLAGRPATTLAVATDDLAASAATVHRARGGRRRRDRGDRSGAVAARARVRRGDRDGNGTRPSRRGRPLTARRDAVGFRLWQYTGRRGSRLRCYCCRFRVSCG
ncbi:ThiJ/PfpI domain-containing protein [Natrinema gari JCM 14663]|uniref:ThiJ/PfpI domain-containing protein n=1 Tax=Natrinema gari JCM 14663 TaxID=1230459 RepID=L9Z0P3_9EURY|nr:ThiJ/PfpI domain-containing protein [Natrinema gari JCM 14663]